MAKGHPALQERFKTRTGELQSPLLCLLFAYLTSFVAVAPFFRTKDPRVTSKTDKFFNKALHTLAGVEDKYLSEFLGAISHICYIADCHITPCCGICRGAISQRCYIAAIAIYHMMTNDV